MRSFLATVLLCLFAATSHAELPLLAAVDEMHADAAKRVAAGRFEALVADADRYLQTEERFADGRWKLAILWWGIFHALEHGDLSQADWARAQAKVTAFAKRHPASPNAWLMVATVQDAHGWAARGNGCGCELDRTENGAFKRYSMGAKALLAAHPAPDNPAWYVQRLSIEGDLGASSELLEQIFSEAIKREPGYQQTWFTRLHYFEPKWGGSMDELIAFINRGALETSATEGRGMMARLLWMASKEGYDEPLNDPRVDWGTLKTSFEDVLKRYPDDWNAQWFFIQACRHADKPEAGRLLASIKQPPSEALFYQSGVPFEGCAAWASHKANSFTLFDKLTGQSRRVR